MLSKIMSKRQNLCHMDNNSRFYVLVCCRGHSVFSAIKDVTLHTNFSYVVIEVVIETTEDVLFRRFVPGAGLWKPTAPRHLLTTIFFC